MLILRGTRSLALVLALAGAWLLISPTTVDVGPAVVELQLANAVLLVFVSVLAAIVSAYSLRNLLGQRRLARFGALLLVAYLGLLVMVTAGTLAQFAVGWTLSGQATAALVAHAGTATALRARRYVATWLSASDVLVWLAVLATGLLGSPQVELAAIGFSGSLAGGLLVVGAIIRTGLVPANRWLAQTAEAPSPVSAFLHAGIINAAGIAAVLWLPLLRPWLPLLLASAAASLIVGLLTIRARTDVKGRLASSTGTQMAFMSMEAAIGLPGLALLHLIGHGSYKSWCFLRAGGAITRGRLGRAHAPWSWPLAGAALALGLGIAALVWLVLDAGEPLTVAVGVVACTAVVARSSGLAPGRTMAIAVTSATGLVAYLLVVHAWLHWVGLPQWQDAWTTSVALAALVVAVALPSLLPAPVLHRLAWPLIAPRWMHTRAGDVTGLGPVVRDPSAAEVVRLHELVEAAASAVAPTWPLRTAVAINPLAALSDLDFAQAAAAASSWGAQLHPSPRRCLQLLASGDISSEALERAAGGPLQAAHLIERTQALATHSDHEASPPTAAWETAHRWCQVAWPRAAAEGDCFAAWRASLPARVRAQVSPIPVAALRQALDATLRRHPDAAHGTAAELRLLQQLLVAAPGWAAHAHWRGHDALVQLLALRACLTWMHLQPVTGDLAPASWEGADIWQQALESSFDSWLDARLAQAHGLAPADSSIGVVTCIDVRSEPWRRTLEQVAAVRTYGAAGFFGVDARLELDDCVIDLAPVIVTPSIRVPVHLHRRLGADLSACIDAAMDGPAGLAIAEGFGLGALVASAADTFAPRLATRIARLKQPDPWLGATGLDAAGLPVDEQVARARAFLDGLGGGRLPDLVVVAGHSADAANNAFAAAYQCGACGGNTGAINARLIVAMLNDPDVRARLMVDGYEIEGTQFIAALHHTTTQALEIDPCTAVPDSHLHLIDQLVRAADEAQRCLALVDRHLPGPRRDDRGIDWAQPFPEWGLVGNAACIIGPRSLTAGADLGGRVFLHEYDWMSDHDGSMLRSILQGPGTVMHMINMQYLCSSVDQGSFGSLDKTRHNVVGDLGVLVGATGDLHYGLPWQSLGPDPDHPRHAPVRLRIRVAAPPDLLAAAMSGTGIEQLAANGWLSVSALTAPTSTVHQEAR